MKFRYLDGLRGLAALIVVIDHLAIAFFQRATDTEVLVRHTPFEEVVLQTPLHLLVSGNFSVCIFFVLSGFVLSSKFFRTGQRSVVWASAFRRYARLEIPVLASVILSYLVVSAGLLHNEAAATVSGSTWLPSLWSGLQPSAFGALYHAVAGVFIDGKSPYNTVLWTMQLELAGSFLVFGLLLAVGRWRRRWWVYAALAAGLINSYLVCFVAGVAICDWYFSRQGRISWKPYVWGPALAGSLILGSIPVGKLAGTVYSGLPAWLGYGMDPTHRVHVIGAIGLVAVLVATPLLQRGLEGRVMQALGRTSFGLYLTHMLVLGTLSCWLLTWLVPALGYLAGAALTIVLSGLAMGAVAYVFSRWVDVPAIRLSGLLYRRFFPQRWRSRQAAGEPAAQTVP